MSEKRPWIPVDGCTFVRERRVYNLLNGGVSVIPIRPLRVMRSSPQRSTWLFIALLVIACSPGVPETRTVEVELDLFSGRPNPRWTLSTEEAEELARRIENLPDGGSPTPPPGLGYRGFELTSPGGVADLPRRLRVYSGVLSVTLEGEIRHYRDENRVEAWLAEQARARGHPVPGLSPGDDRLSPGA